MTMTLVETVTLASAASSIEFTSIPQDGVDLLLVTSLRADSASPNVELTFNSDTTSYNHITLRGLTPAVSSISGTGDTYFALHSDRSSDTANTFSSSSLYVSNYAGSTTKSMSLDSVYENNAEFAAQYIVAGLYNDTTAITSIQLAHSSNFVSGSTASLYKIS